MAIRLLTTCPFHVTAADEGGIRIEDAKTGQSWLLTNQQTRDFARIVTGRRKIAENELFKKEHARRMQTWEAQDKT
jgi:hypothetical protein